MQTTGSYEVMRSICEDVAALIHPPPPPNANTASDKEWAARAAAASEARTQLVERFLQDWVHGRGYGGGDPVLAELNRLRAERDRADELIRVLFAYARAYVPPRGYALDSLAQAASMSPSGVRTYYDVADVADVQTRLWRGPLLDEGATVAGPRRRPNG